MKNQRNFRFLLMRPKSYQTCLNNAAP